MDNLSENILTTLVYYDILDYPMTSFEVWKYLIRNKNQEEGSKDEKEDFSLAEVINCLEKDESKKRVEEHRGFYFLRGRKNLVGQRIEGNKISGVKFEIIKKVVFWLRLCPFMRMIAVTGKVAMKNAKKESDLDFLVVLKEGKIFTGRILVTIVTHLLGKRRYDKKITDRICLNFFLADKSLEINLKDIYSSSEYSFIFPVFGYATFQKFQKANSWISNFKPNFSPDDVSNARVLEDFWAAKAFRNLGEAVLAAGFIERGLKKWQMKRIVEDPRTYQKGSGVIASDESLIFLPDPHGPKIYGKFKEKMTEIKA